MTRMEVQPERTQLDPQLPPFHAWTFPDGTPWTRFHRLGDGFLLRFPDLADFELDAGAHTVRCHPAPGVSPQTVWHLFHNQVLPLAQSRQGKLVFHASAVQIGGAAVAFMGASGKGKSTLAGSFAASGFPFLTDDGLWVERASGHWLAMPSQPSIRLWDDAQLAVLGADADAAPPLDFTSKGRFLASPALVHCDAPCTLTHIYLLGEGTATSPSFETLSASQALIELVKHSFLLDIDERRMLATHFDKLSALVSHVPCVRFDFPRLFDALGLVRECLVQDVSKRVSR